MFYKKFFVEEVLCLLFIPFFIFVMGRFCMNNMCYI